MEDVKILFVNAMKDGLEWIAVLKNALMIVMEKVCVKMGYAIVFLASEVYHVKKKRVLILVRTTEHA